MRQFYTLIACLLFMASAQLSTAQNPVTSVKENSNSQYENIIDKLDLMPDQVKSLKKNDENFRRQISSTFDLTGRDEAKLQKAIEKIQSDYDRELKNIFTTHQYKLYHEMMEKARQEEGRMF